MADTIAFAITSALISGLTAAGVSGPAILAIAGFAIQVTPFALAVGPCMSEEPRFQPRRRDEPEERA
jgi:hypothetical protein